MDLSIIIVTYNSSPFIEECLRSFREAIKDVEYEILIVDNASTDETCGLIDKGFPDAVLVRSPMNVGFAKANNLALHRARGEFILLVNPDTLWRRGDIRTAIRFMRSHPHIGGLGCRLILGDGSWQKSHGHFPTFTRELKEAFYLPRLFPNRRWSIGMFIYQERVGPGPVDWVSATFLLCPRRVLLDIGGFDERYFMYYEDIDLSKKMRGTGKEVYYYPEIEIVHFQRMPSLYDFGESPYLYFDKHFGTSFAKRLRYVLLFKTLLRVSLFGPLAFLLRKRVFREKLKTNFRTLEYHVFEAPAVLKRLGDGSESRDQPRASK